MKVTISKAIAAVCLSCSMASSIGTARADGRVPGVADPALAPIAAKAFARHFTAGLAVAVVQGGRIRYAEGFGSADPSGTLPVTPQTPFAIGSLTKQFTAAIALQLVEQRKLALDESIARWLPMLPNARTITVRELLAQTSGLHDYPYLAEHPWPTTGRIHIAQLLDFMALDRPDFSPGSRWEYSNTNYTALAAIEAAVTSQSYRTLLQRRIFSPLKMSQSGLGFAAQRALRPATPFLTDGSGISPVPPARRLSLDLYSGAGGIVSSADDLARWDIALLGGRLLDPAMRRLWWSPGRLADGTTTSYGMGWVVAELDGRRELWHNGYAPGAGGFCFNALFPKEGLAVVILSNTGSLAAEGDAPLRSLAAKLARAALPSAFAERAAPGEDAAVTGRVEALWAAYQAGEPPLAEMEPTFAALFTPAFTRSLAKEIGALGSPKRWIFLGKSGLGAGMTLYRYRAELGDGSSPTFAVAIDAAGKIAGSRLLP